MTDPRDIQADTGNPEADRLIGRLTSADPDFEDCTAAAMLLRQFATAATADVQPDDFVDSVKRLCVAARTTGGTAGRDDALCRALDRVEAMLQAMDDPDWQAQASQRTADAQGDRSVCKPGGCMAIGCEGGIYCYDAQGNKRPQPDRDCIAAALQMPDAQGDDGRSWFESADIAGLENPPHADTYKRKPDGDYEIEAAQEAWEIYRAGYRAALSRQPSAAASAREQAMEAAINRALQSLAGDYQSMAADLRDALAAAKPDHIADASKMVRQDDGDIADAERFRTWANGQPLLFRQCYRVTGSGDQIGRIRAVIDAAKPEEKQASHFSADQGQDVKLASHNLDLSAEDLELFAATYEHIDDGVDTTTDEADLMRFVALGLLECARFTVTAKGEAVYAARAQRAAAQGGE
ncbi:hypothetical protein [Achromobacter aloeverae]